LLGIGLSQRIIIHQRSEDELSQAINLLQIISSLTKNIKQICSNAHQFGYIFIELEANSIIEKLIPESPYF
jgi:DNA polymerase III delta prime subunit